MRLSTIKLSGFKSFVDPTTLHLPTNMTGVVGPNGCGKSNIIDAIRWVMGESAASRLRGDAITDVIFSGSGQRKPVGSAQVELIFDNSDGTIQGEYANFNEISIKRQVSRDGQSNYFLNNARCRRRDIVDVFLGTGLGARSYSIIEQGMISQIVEARPEDLRLHLEEAAGISKYKERRKETESRIKSTRENLDRLSDLRQEVDKHLDHLNRQAKQAERYQKLKAEHARVDAELKALHLRELQGELDARGQALRQIELRSEQLTSEQRAIEARLEEERGKQIEATDHFNTVQGELYRVGGEIARVEQQITYNRDLAERLQRAAKETDTALNEVAEHIRGDQEQIELLRESLAESEPQIETLQIEAENRQEAMRVAEAAIVDWQSRWDAYARDSGEAARAAEVERTRLNFLDKQSLDAANRLAQLEDERRKMDVATLSDGAEAMLLRQEETREKVEQLTQMLDERKLALGQVQEQTRELQHQLNDARSRLQSAKGRLSSLEALQHAALGQEKNAAAAWFDAVGLGKSRRLGESLRVQDGWERAVETVLAGWLEAAIGDAPHQFGDALESLQDGQITVLDGRNGAASGDDRLSARVQGPAAAIAQLDRVRVADSLAAAKQIAAGLGLGDSVVTPEGEWLGRDWLRVAKGSQAGSGVLARERELQTLGESIQTLDAQIEELIAHQEELKQANFEAERARDDAQRDLYFSHRQLSEIAGQIQSERGKLEAAQQRTTRIDAELVELRARIEQVDAEAREARGRLDSAVMAMGDQEELRVRLDGERRQFLERREDARGAAREASEQAHQLALRTESKRSALSSLEQSLGRMLQQLATLQSRKSELADQMATQSDPGVQLDAELRTYLDQRMLVDRRLIEARKALETCDLAFRSLEQDRHRVERELSVEREKLSGVRLEEQSLRMRADSHAEAIAGAGFASDTVAAELPAEATVEVWEAKAIDLEQKIRRLEPVNLAAIQEFAEQSTRKQYLDAQNADLAQALETLEGAIKKIDKETRTRFKETFDKVNTGLQELFPRLFGGGHAYLELTGEDLLDTGVSIMARPPGKRVTSISLLSGGEKALTAVALVFSIFRLNPAPFCLLDEVDAPLDEANVGRFCNMVSEMSERVQFLFVTHNKATMEAANQLCGVTMREPGVSRLVSVDLAEAAKLAGAA
ncbi:MAG: chromosome segregation protein SMC [Xanthomonadales bacterium]|nr:chromosome segregation protein SMC [Xanthomonadales bacterium]MBK7145523.1 chromosome segregation protein SMC [Xanthomonadales bacterium]MCC6562894.1 chromosome segregation protein SMC [Xanthomonadales bacterium]